MRCLICGRLSLPGAKLCLDCKAARKRAFDATVTQPLLAAAGSTRDSTAAPSLLKRSQSVPDAARRAAKMAMATQAQAKAEPEDKPEDKPQHAARWSWIFAVIGVLALLVGYFGHWYGGAKTEAFTPVVALPPVLESRPAPSIAVPAAQPAAVPVGVNAVDAGAASPVGKANPVKKPSVRLRVEKAAPPPPAPEPAPAPPPVVIAPPPVPVVREVPRVDPWKPMNDALARCPGNDIPGRYSCEQRVKAQYCEGHWGQVAQCASIPYVDHGQ